MRVTAEQIERANLVNLPEFLESQGFSLKKVGKEYILTEHDSLHIKDNKPSERGKWFQFSADEGGSNIQFVQKFMGLDFISAVELLSDENAILTKANYHSEPEAEPPLNREIAVYDSKDISRVTSYLHGVRGLSAGSLARLIAERKLSQEEKTGNAVFKIFDENGLLVGAEKVGTSGGKFKSIEKGSASGYGFEIVRGNPINTYFFESAIDAVSFADLHPELEDYRLISMSGVKPSVVKETMKRYEIQPKNIYICTDNDKAGNEFAEKLIAQYPAMKRVTPQGAKDWNDILQGRVEKMKLYGNTYWQEATDNRDKTVAVMHEDTFRQLQETLDKSGLNYCAYSDGKNAMVAVNSSEVDRFRTVTGLDESLCRLQKSGRKHTPQDKNIIGNTDYKYIPQKTYINDDRETILKMAELVNKANIQFSARIYPSGKAAMTVSQADMGRVNAIRDEVKAMRKPMIQAYRQSSQEIIGNKPYREIRNRHFFVSPLTPEKYHKIEPKLFERGTEFSGLIRDGKVMFTTEREQAQRFNAILRQTVCENQILENLQNMGLDSQQIQALSSSIEIASRNNMANIIEHYVSKDYDIGHLRTMDNLLTAYLDQNDTSRLLDNGRQLDLLLSAKQEFDLQIAQREELASFEEIYNPENDEIPETPENSLSFHFGDKDSEWFTESDLLYDFVQKNPDMSFALANAVISYLDKKQHTERNIPELHAGWYKKTDFTVTTKINGQEFTHSGRFDIGDGKETGGGTLIDHIEQFAKGALAQGFPYNSEDASESLNYLLENVVPFLKENSELALAEQTIFDDFKAQNPIRTFADVEIAEPPAVADFRAKTEENFRFYNFKPIEVENIVKDFVQKVFEENGIIAEIGGAAITGSRSRGLENADSDIDVVIEIDSDLKEDALFNIIHDEELMLEGYMIDINPIKADETGALETYLPTAEAYLAEKAQHMKEPEQKSDLPTFDVYIYDKESGANSPMRCQAKNADEAMKMADEYIRRWNLIEAEITDVQLVEPEKELAKDETITEKLAETEHPDNIPLLDEKLQTLQQIVNKFFGTDCESAETEHCTWKLAIADGDKVGELFYGGEPVCGIYNRGDKMEIEPYRELDTFPKLLQTAMREHNHDKPVEITNFQRDFETPLDKVKYLINDFCESEYGSPADFSDLHNVSLAYTTLTDDELPIQVTADLVDFKITYEFNNEIFNIEKYENIENMIENGLTGLDFSDLISVPESVIEKHSTKDGQTITTSEIEKSSKIENDDTPLFDESVIAEAGLGFVPDKELNTFRNNEQDYEQLTLFGETEPINKSAPTNNYTSIQYGKPVADVNRSEELHKEIMRGSGFQDGKFRIAEFFQEHNPNNKEFADFLKDEYGTGGHTADSNIFMVDYDSKGMQFTVRSMEGGISEEKFDFSWTEVAKSTADLIKHDKYITQDDIDRRISNAKFKIEHFNPEYDSMDTVAKARAILEKYDVEEKKTASEPVKTEIKPDIKTVTDENPEPEVKTNDKSQNFTITDDKLGEGGAKTKFKNNLLAIQTLKQIEIEDRCATPEEQAILSKYVGWGGLAQAFDSNNEQWGKEFSQLFNALTPKEYEDARKSVLDSFFTSPAIIDGIYEALEKFGFSGGNLLEPSCGVGNFLGKMPSEMAEHTHIYGVEIDSISGRIAKQLYPDADIQVTGFENTNFQNGSFDIAVGNVPFGDLNFPDKQYGTTKLHDFFFAQTLDNVRVKNGE